MTSLAKSYKITCLCAPAPTIMTSTSSDSLSNCRGSKFPCSSVSALEDDFENGRTWHCAPVLAKSPARWLFRFSVTDNEPRGFAIVDSDAHTLGVRNEEGRSSRLMSDQTGPFEAMIAMMEGEKKNKEVYDAKIEMVEEKKLAEDCRSRDSLVGPVCGEWLTLPRLISEPPMKSRIMKISLSVGIIPCSVAMVLNIPMSCQSINPVSVLPTILFVRATESRCVLRIPYQRARSIQMCECGLVRVGMSRIELARIWGHVRSRKLECCVFSRSGQLQEACLLWFHAAIGNSLLFVTAPYPWCTAGWGLNGL